MLAFTVLLAASSQLLGAQHAVPAAVTARPERPIEAPDAAALEHAVRPAKAPYVWGGAIGGALISAIAFAAGSAGDAPFYGAVAIVTTVAAAGIGAGLGWITYHVVH